MFRKTLIALIGALTLGACSVVPTGGGQASVEDAAEQLRLLMIDPEKTRLEALVADELSYGHSGGRVDTKASFIGDLMSGASDFVTIAISDQTVRRAHNMVLIRHTLAATTNDSGKPGAVTLKVLQVWTYADGRWQLVARQAVRPPAQ